MCMRAHNRGDYYVSLIGRTAHAAAVVHSELPEVARRIRDRRTKHEHVRVVWGSDY